MSKLVFQCRHQYASGYTVEAQFETDGGVTALFGPSGAGKTTILSIVAGILRPQSGLVILGDRVWLDTEKKQCLSPERRQVGFVFQDDLLFPHLSVKANLRYGMPSRSRPESKLEHVVAILELKELLHRYPRSLSGGERRRVALGRAILRNPQLLLLDEPLTGLDDRLKDRVVEYVQRVLQEYRLPTLLVTHEKSLVDRIADRTIQVGGGGSS